MSKKSISKKALACDRRKFLTISALTTFGLMYPGRWSGRALAFNQTPTSIRKFIVPLPGLGPSGIPVATPNTTRFSGKDYYEVEAGQYTQQLHPDLGGPTTLWGYADVTGGATPNHRYLGGLIVAQKGRPVILKKINKLPNTHPLPVDMSMEYMSMRTLVNRISCHLHGGFTPWMCDGVPFADFDPAPADGGTGFFGESCVDVASLIPGMDPPGPGHFSYYYPNLETARFMWYHDHAMGLTRLNAYSGLATGYVLQDSVELTFMADGVIPPMSQMIPLVIQDKVFQSNGKLWYPSVYEKNSQLPLGTGRWDWGGDMIPPSNPVVQPPATSGIPEFFADTPVINGALYPYLQVEQRHYRFRILNGSQARYWNLSIVYASSTNNKEVDLKYSTDALGNPIATLDKTKVVIGPPIIQIGTEGGFLPAPVALNTKVQDLTFDPVTGNPTRFNLLLSPAERADIVVDFTNVPVGSKLILYNDAPAPFPGGDIRNDYYTGAPSQVAMGGAPTPLAGFGPNTRTLMQFQVVARTSPADPPSMNVVQQVALCQLPMAFNPFAAIARLSTAGAAVRNLTLNEDFDGEGRLIQMVGTNVQNGLNNQGLPTWGRPYESMPTEIIARGSTEIWRIYNLTGDTHPMHFHLVNVQLLSRQPFNAALFPTVRYTGPARAPDANERGWKETVKMHPGECTTVMAKFDLPSVPFTVPNSPRLQSMYGVSGHEYVWHCHILEHEEHDMMRPLVVT